MKKKTYLKPVAKAINLDVESALCAASAPAAPTNTSTGALTTEAYVMHPTSVNSWE